MVLPTPIITVVIPYFNRADTIGRALTSVIQQTCSAWEIILVDDACPNSAALAQALEEFLPHPQIRLLKHSQNRGVSAARNTGIAAARGRYVALLDSDDYWLPEKLARQLAAVQGSTNPDCVLCLVKTRILMPDGWSRIRPLQWPRLDASGKAQTSLAHYLYCEGGFMQCSAFFVSTALARQVPFHEHLRQYEDHLFVIELQAAGAQLLLLDEVLTVWVNDARPGRLSAADNISRAAQFIEIARKTVEPSVLSAFAARTTCELLWKQSRIAAIKLLIKAVAGGGLTLIQATVLLIRMVTPVGLYQTLRRWLTSARQAR